MNRKLLLEVNEMGTIPGATLLFASYKKGVYDHPAQWYHAGVIVAHQPPQAQLTTEEKVNLLHHIIDKTATVISDDGSGKAIQEGASDLNVTYIHLERDVPCNYSEELSSLLERQKQLGDLIAQIELDLIDFSSIMPPDKWEVALANIHAILASSNLGGISTAKLVERVLFDNPRSFQELRDGYKGTTEETLEELKELLRPISEKATELQMKEELTSLIKTIQTLSGQVIFLTSTYPREALHQILQEDTSLETCALVSLEGGKAS